MQRKLLMFQNIEIMGLLLEGLLGTALVQNMDVLCSLMEIISMLMLELEIILMNQYCHHVTQ
jgi:hypothetical protein